MAQDKVRALQARAEQQKASRELLLHPRRFRQDVLIEGLGAEVTLQSLSQEQRKDIQEKAQGDDGTYDGEQAGLLTIVACVVDPELTLNDLEALKQQDAAIIDELHMHIALMNQMGKVPELKKGSSKTGS